jgi:hypothetical protein
MSSFVDFLFVLAKKMHLNSEKIKYQSSIVSTEHFFKKQIKQRF